MPLEIPDTLVAWAKKHIKKEDDLGMTQKLGEAFDNLSLGVTTHSLGDIIAVAAIFIAIQDENPDVAIAQRFAQMEADLKKFDACPLIGPVSLPVILPVTETLVEVASES